MSLRVHLRSWHGELAQRNKKDKPKSLSFRMSFNCQKSDSAFNLIGTEASCTDIDMAGRTIDDCFHALYIGLPSSVGASVGMGDLNAECNTLAANIALCQLLHLQSLRKSSQNTALKHAGTYISRVSAEKQEKFYKK